MNNSADHVVRPYISQGLSPAWRIALAYAIFGALWILFSDRLLAAVVANPAQLTEWQTYKGWLFVATSTLFLFLLLERSYARQVAVAIHNVELFRQIQAHSVELEARVAERTQELSNAMERAQTADRLKSTFLATMSHELRTPLNSIIGFTGVLVQELAGPLLPEQKKQLGMIQASARHLLALINDVLDISKIEAGQLELAREPVDLPGVIDGAVRSIMPMARRKGLTIHVTVDPAVDRVVTDRRRVEQILLNLLHNAVKFTEHGGVELRCIMQGDYVSVTISDTGIGIRPEDKGRLFRPFQQLEDGVVRQREGTGLGLSICASLVKLLGGTIAVDSEWGTGSTFTVTFPASESGLDGKHSGN